MQVEMRRRKKVLVLKLMAGGFILLLIFHMKWHFLGSLSSSPYEGKYIKKVAHKKPSVIRQLVEPASTEMPCHVPHLKHQISIPESSAADCTRIPPDRDSCLTAVEMFHDVVHDKDHPCRSPVYADYCSIQVKGAGVEVKCEETCAGAWKVGVIDLQTGEPVWDQYKTNRDLETAIRAVIAHPHEGYCLLHCESDETVTQQTYFYDGDNWDSVYPHILNLPPYLEKRNNYEDTGNGNQNHSRMININMIFVDSVSRHHFYRSLPKTVSVLEKINSQENGRKDLVLDFELIQALKSRTFETLQALFSGLVDPYTKPFGTQEMPKVQLKLSSMFQEFKNLEYNTLWLEDLCPYWEWGLSKDLLVYNKSFSRNQIWSKFKRELKQAYVDSVGNTFAGCGILSVNGVPDPFHGPDKLCYHGYQQHEYQLKYLMQYQKTMVENGERFFSFLETNVGHEDYGIRIQYLDSSMAEYVNFASGLKQTVTVIFSDHGNAYGSYVEDTTEGRIETFHPFMFIIIPEDVQSLNWMAKTRLKSLILNQKRLISMLDLHYTIKHLVREFSSDKSDTKVSDFNHQYNVSNVGLLAPVSKHRTCSFMPRIMPNLCICSGYDIESDNFEYNYILAQYFVGMLNNEIQHQRRWANGEAFSLKEGNSNPGSGRCHYLKVGGMKNIQMNRIDLTTSLLKMDLYVTSESQIQNEIFFVTLQQNYSENRLSTRAFERITPYSIFSVCADTGVDIQLCVCDRNSSSSSKSKHKFQLNLHSGDSVILAREIISSIVHEEMDHSVSMAQVEGNKCFYIIRQSNKAGVIYSGLSICDDLIEVVITFQAENVLLSESTPTVFNVNPWNVRQIITGVVKDDHQSWQCKLAKVKTKLLGSRRRV